MNTSLFSIVIAVIENLNHKQASIKEQDEAVKNLCSTLKMVFAKEDQQAMERELFSIAQQCRDGLNKQCGTIAMELLETYMA